jgi:hypothetical protein
VAGVDSGECEKGEDHGDRSVLKFVFQVQQLTPKALVNLESQILFSLFFSSSLVRGGGGGGV